MRRWLFFLFLVSFNGFAQQSPQYSQYIRNQYMINPAATGVYDFLDVSIGGRMQWLGVPGGPKTSYAYISAPVRKVGGARMKRTYGKIRRNKRAVRHPRIRRGSLSHAFGGHFLADQYGPFRQLKLMGTYAVHLPVNRDYSFSFGTNVGLSNRVFIPENAQVLSVLVNNGVHDATYANYQASQGSQFTMDVEAGIYFYGDNVFAGISANQLTGQLAQFGNRAFNFDPGMHFFLTGGYKFEINPRTTITPALLVKYIPPAPVSWELSAQVDYRERWWFGASYRHKDAVVLMVGGTISNQFRIGYSFDLNTSRFIRYSAGGHELVMSFMIGRDQNKWR